MIGASVEDKLRDIFVEVFEVSIDQVGEIDYQSVATWDSIGHMVMVSEIESAFGVSLDMDDVIAISNFETCIEKLTKYL